MKKMKKKRRIESYFGIAIFWQYFVAFSSEIYLKKKTNKNELYTVIQK